jgi:histidinol-phosphate aminotransferase
MNPESAMPCDYEQLPHVGIRTLIPYVPGKSSEQLASEQGLTDILKLAGNENPSGCSPLVTQALAQLATHQVATYPMSAIHPLRKKLADKLGVDTEMITLGNGSDSLFGSLLTCFALHNDKHILTHDCAFSTYAIQAKTLGIPVVSTGLKSDWEVDIDAMIRACHEKTALIFIANPNNPTGVMINPEEIKRLLENIPETTLFVLDEAYYEYVRRSDKDYSIALLKKHPNLVITRTFSKAYGLAGLRLGYTIAHPQITALLYRIQLPFVVNIAALTAGFVALDDDEFIRQTVHINDTGLQHMQQGLNTLGLNHLPSAGNFITFDLKKDSMPMYLGLQRQGIIVRPLHPYGLNSWLRVTIGTREQNNRFLDVLSRELNHE